MRTKFRTLNRTLLLLVACTLAVVTAYAERPSRAQVSPWATVSQMIGSSLIEMEFSRPGVKGRQIWGDLVPYDVVWRAGANARTVVSFEDDVTINGEPLAAGSYGLLILPREDEPWIVIFSKNYMSHGSEEYSQENDALRVEVEPQEAPHREWLLYGFENLRENGADLFMHWEKLKLSIEISLDS